MSNSTLNPIEKLAQLSSQRTARTDRLHSAVRDLTDALEAAGARPDKVRATVDGWTLAYYEVRSNVGVRDCWSLSRGHGGEEDYDGCSDLGLAVDHDGYLHGDFHTPISGPTRAHLIAFAQRAEQFVAAIVASAEAELAALESAQTGVNAALASVTKK